MEKTICELFAGVGSFRLGFDWLASGWKTTWFSQWEPGKKVQWAHDCYVQHFGDSPDIDGELHTGEDIIKSKGFMVTAFPISEVNDFTITEISNDIFEVSEHFGSAFENAGFMSGGKKTTAKIKELEETPMALKEIQEKEPVSEKLFIPNDKMEKWSYLKLLKEMKDISSTIKRNEIGQYI